MAFESRRNNTLYARSPPGPPVTQPTIVPNNCAALRVKARTAHVCRTTGLRQTKFVSDSGDGGVAGKLARRAHDEPAADQSHAPMPCTPCSTLSDYSVHTPIPTALATCAWHVSLQQYKSPTLPNVPSQGAVTMLQGSPIWRGLG